MPIRRSAARPRVAAALRSPAALVAALAVAACSAVVPVDAQEVIESQEHRFRAVPVVTGLTMPWSVAFLPGGDILITEKAGRVRLVRDGRLRAEPVATVPGVWARGQGGLLDIVPHPDFERNRFVYLTYSKDGGERGATTALARARWDGTRLADLEDLFVADAWGPRGQHFGSRIVFDGQGMLFMSVGERGEKTPAQDVGDHKGTILRLHDDGRVPADNPLRGRAGAKPEIYSYGHRNPQGMAMHPETRALYASEHGARGGDEINLIRPGLNYGWPAITHGIDYNGTPISPDSARAGMEQPMLHWTPSIAPSGLAVYTGDRFPRWRGNLIAGSLAGQQLRRVVLDGDRVARQETLLQGRGRIRTVRLGPDGHLYILLEGPQGSLVRLEPVE